MNRHVSIAVAAAFALAPGAFAQVQKGKAPPPIEFAKVWNNGPASFDEFDGRVVILDFAATW